MGQKTHPYGMRVSYIKPWRARWFSKKNVADILEEDLKLRRYIKSKLGFAGISNIEIERSSGRVRVRIFTARPGVIIGRRGQEIDKIKEDLSNMTNDELFVDIKEVKNPQTDSQLVAENIALQLEKRVGFRRAMKRAIQMAMAKGALGIKVICKGRLGGSEIARAEKYHEGSIPLNTFRADIDYGFAEAHTTYGSIGVKVWIYKGDVLVKKEKADQRSEWERHYLKKESEVTAGATEEISKTASTDTAVANQETPSRVGQSPEGADTKEADLEKPEPGSQEQQGG